VFIRRAAAIGACLMMSVSLAPAAWADPNPGSPADAAPAVDDGRVPSGPPANLQTPDGWTLALSSRDETALPVSPLTTAVSSRDYIVSGTYTGSLSGPGEARGTLEVGYDIGCGIDMSTSNGVSLTGTAGLTPQLGVTVPVSAMPTPTILPVLATPVGGAITVGLKPGIINIVPVDKKDFKGNEPWVMVSNFHVKIDGCVGQSFIRSYATLTRQTDQSDVVLSWVGVTKAV
jgi:MspA